MLSRDGNTFYYYGVPIIQQLADLTMLKVNGLDRTIGVAGFILEDDAIYHPDTFTWLVWKDKVSIIKELLDDESDIVRLYGPSLKALRYHLPLAYDLDTLLNVVDLEPLK